MPRRYADYRAQDGFTLLNTISSVGAFLLGLSTLPFLYNVWRTVHHGVRFEGAAVSPGVVPLHPQCRPRPVSSSA